MTREDLVAELEVLACASGRDLADLQALALDEAQLLVRGYEQARAPRERQAAETVGQWLATAASIAGATTSIAGAIAAIFGVVTAAKGAT